MPEKRSAKTYPLAAFGGTVATTVVPSSDETGPDAPAPNPTWTPARFVPVIVTTVPGFPAPGLTPVIVMSSEWSTVNALAEVAVPFRLTTAIGPVTAPAGTAARSVVSLFAPKTRAGTPLNVTEDVPVKPEPPMVTIVPSPPDGGVKVSSLGGTVASTVKSFEDTKFPVDASTSIGPVVAPSGTLAVMCESSTTVKVAFTPPIGPKRTLCTAENPVPTTLTELPAAPLVGVKEVIVGGGRIVKLVDETTLPTLFTTLMGAVTAPEGTVATTVASSFTLKVAERAPKLTDVVAPSAVPVIVTLFPLAPALGENPEIVGAAVSSTTKFVAESTDSLSRIGPVPAPAGTTAVICVGPSMLKVACTPPKSTDVTPSRLVPVMTAVSPAEPLVGENPVNPGGASTVKLEADTAVPRVFVTEMGPVVAPAGTYAEIRWSLSTKKFVLGTPLNATPVVPVKFAPLTRVKLPADPAVGEKPVIVGEAVLWTRNDFCVFVPPTTIGPLIAPVGTVAVICASLSTVKFAHAPPNWTSATFVKPDPVITTVSPTLPLRGEKPETEGGGGTTKSELETADPSVFVTVMGPLVAPAGTNAWRCVSSRTCHP